MMLSQPALTASSSHACQRFPLPSASASGMLKREVQLMLLEDYFDFLSQNEIRLRGHRIGIEDVLYEHIYNELTPAELAERFPTLSAEQIYATILYYLNNR